MRADDKFGAKPLTHDHQFIVRHGGPGNELDFLVTKHVDAACAPATLQGFIASLESLFGKGRTGHHPREFHQLWSQTHQDDRL